MSYQERLAVRQELQKMVYNKTGEYNRKIHGYWNFDHYICASCNGVVGSVGCCRADWRGDKKVVIQPEIDDHGLYEPIIE